MPGYDVNEYGEQVYSPEEAQSLLESYGATVSPTGVATTGLSAYQSIQDALAAAGFPPPTGGGGGGYTPPETSYTPPQDIYTPPSQDQWPEGYQPKMSFDPFGAPVWVYEPIPGYFGKKPGARGPLPTGWKEGVPGQQPDGSWGFYSYDADNELRWTKTSGPSVTATPPTLTPYEDWLKQQDLWQRGLTTQQFAQQQLQAQQDYALRQEQYGLQQQELAWQKEQAQLAVAETQKQRMAELAANPQSWLEYAAYSGATPMVQPWMIPLMGQQYAGTVAGAALPGWQNIQGEMGQGVPSMAQLPGLTTPSTQYQARMGPTAYQQYAGYEKARTGISPAESEFRLWSQAPPSGRANQLRYAR